MAFSIFNKKSGELKKPPVGQAKRAPGSRADVPAGLKPQSAVPQARESSPAVTVAKIDEIEAAMGTLDFSANLASASGRSGAKPLVEHGFQGASSTKTGNAQRPPAQPAPREAASPGAASAAGAAPRNPAPAANGIRSVMMMEVQQNPFEAVPALEEAAILYANRQEDTAVTALEEAIRDEKVPAQAARQAWMMLFDVYENQGRRAEFEAVAMDFAVRFETSPPAFTDRSVVKDLAADKGGRQNFTLTGRLDGDATRQIEQMKVAARKHRLRADFGKIEAVAPEGCEVMRDALAALRKSAQPPEFAGVEHLIDLLTDLIETGRREDPECYWLLLLDLYQLQDMQDSFEETALNYCVTYEVSPPSWVEAAKPVAVVRVKEADAADMPLDACYLKGELEGDINAVIKAIGNHSAEREQVVIDVFDVKRMDFLAAGALLNLVSSLSAAGKQVEIRGPSPLLAALYVTMGFTACAKLTRRTKRPS